MIDSIIFSDRLSGRDPNETHMQISVYATGLTTVMKNASSHVGFLSERVSVLKF